jgi:hypothetical protein
MAKHNINKYRQPKTAKKQGKVHVVNFSSYTRPEVVEVQNKDWIEYGDDNDYFGYLIDRYNGSPTNNAAINGIADMIYGKGLDAVNGDKNPEQYAEMKSLFSKKCLKSVCYDYKMMGNAAFQVIYSKDRTRIAQVEHIPVQLLRAEKADEKGNIKAYYYSNDWSEVSNSRKNVKRIPAFGFSKENIEIVYIKPYKAGYFYYSPVDYQGGIQYAELEEEIANYHINNIQNGLITECLLMKKELPSSKEYTTSSQGQVTQGDLY